MMSEVAGAENDGPLLETQSDQVVKASERVEHGPKFSQVLTEKVKGFFDCLGQYVGRLFTVPLVKDIIYFDCGGLLNLL